MSNKSKFFAHECLVPASNILYACWKIPRKSSEMKAAAQPKAFQIGWLIKFTELGCFRLSSPMSTLRTTAGKTCPKSQNVEKFLLISFFMWRPMKHSIQTRKPNEKQKPFNKNRKKNWRRTTINVIPKTENASFAPIWIYNTYNIVCVFLLIK